MKKPWSAEVACGREERKLFLGWCVGGRCVQCWSGTSMPPSFPWAMAFISLVFQKESYLECYWNPFHFFWFIYYYYVFKNLVCVPLLWSLGTNVTWWWLVEYSMTALTLGTSFGAAGIEERKFLLISSRCLLPLAAKCARAGMDMGTKWKMTLPACLPPNHIFMDLFTKYLLSVHCIRPCSRYSERVEDNQACPLPAKKFAFNQEFRHG